MVVLTLEWTSAKLIFLPARISFAVLVSVPSRLMMVGTTHMVQQATTKCHRQSCGVHITVRRASTLLLEWGLEAPSSADRERCCFSVCMAVIRLVGVYRRSQGASSKRRRPLYGTLRLWLRRQLCNVPYRAVH
jgi:hypothetical protein